jgi:aspartyl-tRNA(Asn)/glutamyl-tRNA(Gln) amidotransferase subunit B
MFTDSPFSNYDVVIGLECHVQLLTKSKLFSPARNNYGDEPNVNVDVVDLGLPGVLPALNEKAVVFAIRLGEALNCTIHRRSVFARKHYFYPDLPKGYQISQHNEPICGPGVLPYTVNGEPHTLEIERIHMEEDAGKNIHVEEGASSFVDYNRAGTPLLEVVSAPGLRNAEQAMGALTQLRTIAMYLEICDGNLQEGSLRFDVNVSVKRKGETTLGTRTETKNLNSIRYVGQAIEYEARRQILALEAGQRIVQETRLWDPNRKESRSMRSKEDAHDYRYFPDPDLPALMLTEDTVAKVKASLPELPDQKMTRFCDQLQLSDYDAKVLVSDKALADYFEAALKLHSNGKAIANWIINDVLRVMKSTSSDESIGFSRNACPVPPESIASLVRLIDNKTITGKIAKQLFEDLVVSDEKDPAVLAKQKNLIVERDESALRVMVDEILANNPKEVAKYLDGRDQVFGFFVGQAMKMSRGLADPEEVTKLFNESLAKLRAAR